MRVFNEAGVLAAADVHVALRLQKLGRETSEPVLLATAMAVRAVRAGSVCLDLTRLQDAAHAGSDGEGGVADLDDLPWPDENDLVDALRRSPLVIGADTGPLRPLRLVDTDEGPLLYLARYFRQEQTIRRILDERARTRPMVVERVIRESLERLFPYENEAPVDRQRVASALAATSWTTVVAGGPGTGKTHTVARILALLTETSDAPPRIGLAAPTGKAAARLQESVLAQAESLTLPENVQAMTVHRLLGWQRGTTRYRYNADNRLPYEAIVVDETSMVSLTMMCRLLEAVRSDTRLLLVGDPDQLTSVDAGAVLADLVARPTTSIPNPALELLVPADMSATGTDEALTQMERDRLDAGVVRLTRGRRFGGDIGELAEAVRDGDADSALEILARGTSGVSFHRPEDLEDLRNDVVRASLRVHEAAEKGDASGALTALESHRLLCAHRDGPFGVERWAARAVGWVGEATGRRLDPHQWYPGQPLLVTANDYEARIYNGDAGVVVRGENGEPTAAFERGDGIFLRHPSLLSAVQTVYAMTIHRSQGSQYDTVSVVLPDEKSALLTRELLYTAITRARTHVRLIGTEEAIRAGIERRVLRASGLRRDIRPYDGLSSTARP
ncbi:exodeoxyribonuclease V subunit alpha [Rhodococcus sp. NPDC058521]|uniref:exodeoxyribonuclease V subunit alpha n=1 Tax=Rhodococcus sp. NPDC058521 TaxID=3346536 RepID=UPI003657CAF2